MKQYEGDAQYSYMVGWMGGKNVNDSEANGMGKEE